MKDKTMIPDYDKLSLDELKAEIKRKESMLERKELIIKLKRLDRQLGITDHSQSIERIMAKIKEAGEEGISISRLQGKLGGGNKSAMTIDEVKTIVISLLDQNQITQVKTNKGLRVKAKN